MPTIHYIKLDLQYCDDVFSGAKPFEIRYNDRDYKVGDVLYFIPVKNGQTVEHPILRHAFLIKYILQDERFLQPGFVAMTIMMLEDFL